MPAPVPSPPPARRPARASTAGGHPSGGRTSWSTPRAVVVLVAILALLPAALSGCGAVGAGDGRAVAPPSATGTSAPAPPTTNGPVADTGTTASPMTDPPGTTPDTAASAPAPPDRTLIAWKACGAHVQCGTLRVPLDHGAPTGPGIDLAVARRPATGPGERIGSLFFNPGGPGAAGVDYVRNATLDARLNQRFDIVSWDPRGVGGSAPVSCGPGTEAYRALDWSPDDATERQQLDAAAQQIAASCAAAHGDELAHVSTDDTARDLDQLRAAVGDDQLTFIGFSYGTFIGLRYAALFPDHVRAMVLDGVVDPTQDLEGLLAGQTEALEAHMRSVFAGCTTTCPVRDAAATYDRVAARVEQRPLPAGALPAVGPTALAFATISSSYDAAGATSFLTALAAADQGDGSPMRALADQYWASSSFTSYLAILCADSPHPEGGEAYDRLAAHLRTISPRFGDALANEVRACAFWAAPPPPAPGPVHATGAPPILVVGNRGDVATPFSSAQQVTQQLDRGVLLTFDGTGHTSFGKSSCVDGAIQRYLLDLTEPDPAAVCH